MNRTIFAPDHWNIVDNQYAITGRVLSYIEVGKTLTCYYQQKPIDPLSIDSAFVCYNIIKGFNLKILLIELPYGQGSVDFVDWFTGCRIIVETSDDFLFEMNKVPYTETKHYYKPNDAKYYEYLMGSYFFQHSSTLSDFCPEALG